MIHNSNKVQSYFLLTLLTFALFITACSRQKWEVLFNGTDLEGWTIKALPDDVGKEYWSVKDGYIECNSMGDGDHNYIWLITDQEFGDFHLKLKFQVFKSSTGNSGVQFRSRYDDSDDAPNGGWLNGPQADIHGPTPMRTGLIYDETLEARRWIYPSLPNWEIPPALVPAAAKSTQLIYHEDDPDAWNTMEIICNDMLVQTVVNDNLVTDLRAEGILDDEYHQRRNVGRRGHIALQLHQNDELLIRFKEILIRDL